MSVTPVVPTPPESIGEEIKNFFGKIGKELGVIGTDALKVLGLIAKDTSAYEPLVAATISAIFPGTSLPLAAVSKIIQSSISTSQTVAQALQAEGLNPTLNQAAAISVATQAHLSGATTAQITAAVKAGTALADTAAGSTPTS